MYVSNSTFQNFGAGAIFTCAKPQQEVIIQDSTISDCSVVGVFCSGEGTRQCVQRMTITNVEGPGVKVGKGNKSKIKGNTITLCQNAIDCVSNQANIIMNTCNQNYENGIRTIAKKGIRCDTIVQFNTCLKNKEHGVFCTGAQNWSRVDKNCNLSQNGRTGVCAADGASIYICNNRIESNFAQGILLIESTYAYIEKNHLSKNFKANIAYGGSKACDTVIINNRIERSRAEGIFAIESGYAWIIKNKIIENADGILIYDSSPNIDNNDISENTRSGITCCGASYPHIVRNKIYGHTQSGLNMRDNSKGLVYSNEIYSNFYQISTRAYKKEEINEMLETNEIRGENEFSANCVIF
jgi:F-box protein 11